MSDTENTERKIRIFGSAAILRSRMAHPKHGAHNKRRVRLPIVSVLTIAMLLTTIGFVAGPSRSAPSATHRSGGTLIYARNQEPPTLNPIGCADNGCIGPIIQIFDQLVEVGYGRTPQPGLAKSWSRSKDGKRWLFNLREARFSNGARVTAADVVFSIKRFANPNVNKFYSGLGDSIKSVRAAGPTRVVINLKRTDGAFLDNLSSFVPSIIPKTYYEKVGDKAFGEKPIGSGAFQVKKFARGDRLELVRNPYYWKKGRPFLDGVTMLYVTDDNTRMLKVTSGEAQVGASVPYSQIDRIDRQSGISVKVEPYSAWDAIWLNVKKKPLDETKVRLALNYATPKQAILQTVLRGNATAANSLIGKVKYWSPRVKTYPYDLNQARQLLAGTSVPQGFSIGLLIPSGDVVVRQIAELTQQAWAKIGVKAKIQQADLGTAFDRWFKGSEMSATFATNSLSSDTLSDDNLGVVFYYSKGGANAFGTGWSNPEVDRLFLKASGSLSEAVRKAAYARIQAISMAEPPAVPLFFTESRTALSDKVKGYRTTLTGWQRLEEVSLSG
jgi:peptide/nickel transport system substrate-binding protein